MHHFVYPDINPIAFHIGPIEVHWYGLMYLVGFVSAWFLAKYRARSSKIWSSPLISDLIFYSAIGVVVGGRIGYMLFYDWNTLIHHPIQIFRVWDGGMAFHGGFLGVMLALFLFSRKYKMNFFTVTDFVVPLVPIGLGAGRIGNFINGELWGRVTTMPWGMVYPQAGPQPRHPSELYEFLLEGVVLFIVIWIYSAKPRPRMAVSGLFLVLYGLFRSFCELFREPDPQIGFIAFGWLTKGQLLSIPMILLGIFLLLAAYRKHWSSQ
jgi:phosphatidylglycerol:prolipoprotein diacylglycerol transferase